MSDDAFDLPRITKKVNDTYALLASLSMAHEMLRSWSHDSFDECIKKIATNNAETSAKIDGISEKVQTALQEISRVRREIDNKVAPLEREIQNLKDHIKQILTQNEDLKSAGDNTDKKIYALHTTTSLSLNTNLKAMKTELEEKIKSIPIPQDTVNIQQVVKQIQEQLEPIRRESTIATTNINAHVTKFIRLEKGVEMALAQLKNLEPR